MPESGADCGLFAALSVTLTAALRVAATAGVNVTLIVQLAPAARVFEPVGQVFVCAKLAEFAPVIVMPLMLSAALPLLVRVMLFAGLVLPTLTLPKLRLVGLSVTAGAVGFCPVPLKAMACGLLAALSAMLTLAVREPVADGVNVTLMVQVPPGASVAGPIGQVLVWAKSPGFVPPGAMLLMVSAAVPLLVRVTL